MKFFDILSILITVSAVFSYLNHRFLRVPTTIGVMAISLLGSLAVVAAGPLSLGLRQEALRLVQSIDFDDTLLHGMLSFLLFAGALHIDLEKLARQKRIITFLATVGTVLATLLNGLGTWFVTRWLGLPLPFLGCLLFGTLIAPTDPIAVLGILRKAGVPESLETKICGESLFNDGVAVVLFTILLEMNRDPGGATAAAALSLFAREALGGIVYGLVIGWIAYVMLKSIDDYHVEVLITLALVSGGYALADALHISGPLAIVVAGLFIGNPGRMLAMSESTRRHLDTFWELVDEVLNVVLFVLIGLEVLALSWNRIHLAASLMLIPVSLLSRLVSVSVPVAVLRPFRRFSPGVIRILTWGGLHGGISVAMALSLPPGPVRDTLLTATYVGVVFSILVQGLTVEQLVRSV
ncbi:monovalent cation:H+ antiporter, CPA1 family [Desulfacinum hydrothermale DSM 13146]|uniref:Monovalent cation:H+ antiporter, CPA1 family n=1 Tax=Desulfacinum hydrothermale DSM 13146 TaxID=1121390 RepID=A0A1W1XQ60_9BACT|nr:sodium:proton antiporter [Desulfacinum hydrothermale]SMC25992.1 monovalent cation:H+ antiporter, CPA1 family [Desulfacinum hydrothermale DSM 13146]